MSEKPASSKNPEIESEQTEYRAAVEAQGDSVVPEELSEGGMEEDIAAEENAGQPVAVKAPTAAEGMDDDTLTFKRSHVYAALIPLAFVVGLSVGFLFWGRGGGSAESAQAAAPAPAAGSQAQAAADPGAASSAQQPAEEETVPRFDIPLDDDPILGPEDAPITIVEFSDYECPFCRKFHVETFERLLDTYPGQIRFVYRDFPLSNIHSNAIPAAEAANCAREQDVFWEYHDLLFSMQEGLSRSAYMTYADSLGLDMTVFEECLDSRRYLQEVEGDYDFAARLGIRSTPTFFINGLPLVGAQPFDIFKQVIDRELAGEIPG